MFKRPSFLFITALLSLIFFALIAFDFSPYLRGPAPYPPDWRWTYELSNTLSRIWFPVSIIGIIILVFRKYELNLKNKNARDYKTLILLVVLGFLLQISLLYYSRSGIEVLAHRIINPMISGYFTASIGIVDIDSFIRNYNQNLDNYPMYARFHPPGGILFFYFLELILRPFSYLFSNITSTIPSHPDVAIIWKNLSEYQRFSALASGFIISFIASLSIIPIYLASRILHDEKTAIRSAVLFLFVPSVLLFTPLIDIFMPLFTSLALYFFVKGKTSESLSSFFLCGLILFVGVFFTLTFLPILLFFFLALLFDLIQKKERKIIPSIKYFIGIVLGFILCPFVLFFAGLNTLEMTQKIMIFHEAAQSGRGYTTWLFYNIYDFFLFAGIPIALVFAYMIYEQTKKFVKNKKTLLFNMDYLFASFVITLLLVNLTGTVRAETARIWLPFIPILIIVIANFITFKLKFTNRQFSLLLLLQAVQVLIFQSVLVTVW